jgi:hypothetical protein
VGMTVTLQTPERVNSSGELIVYQLDYEILLNYYDLY